MADTLSDGFERLRLTEHVWAAFKLTTPFRSHYLLNISRPALSRRQRYTLGCSQEIFSNEEIELLERYGHWYRRLTRGELRPETKAQRQFVEVAQGERQPETIHEKTWKKYCDRLAWESAPDNWSAMGELRRMPNDRDDWKRMAGAQWGEMMRRSRDRDD